MKTPIVGVVIAALLVGVAAPPCGAAGGVILSRATTAPIPPFPINVIDPEGKPVPDAMVAYVATAEGYGTPGAVIAGRTFVGKDPNWLAHFGGFQ